MTIDGQVALGGRHELLTDGLRVRVASRPGAGPVGTVSDVSPTGQLEPGALVTLVDVANRGSGGADITQTSRAQDQGEGDG